MNILLWILQIALAWFCIGGGYFQMFKIDQLQKNVAAMRALPRGLWAVFGAIGCLAGLGLLVPAATGWMPVLTPISAVVVAVESVVISALYVTYGDKAPLPYSVIMAFLAAFIAYGRFALHPF